MGGQYSLARETKTGNLQKEILEILKTDCYDCYRYEKSHCVCERQFDK